MNPYKLREVYKQLTSQNSILKKYLKLGTDDIKPFVKPEVEERRAFNRFMRDNPRTEKAGGGMLVKPSADGSRPGYAEDKYTLSKGTPGVRFTAKEVKELTDDLKNYPGISLKKVGDSYYFRFRIQKGDNKISESKVATKENLNLLKKRQKKFMKENYPNVLSNADFENLRMQEANINLSAKDFAEVLNNKNKTTIQGYKWTKDTVQKLQGDLKLNSYIQPEGASGKLRAINNAKKIVRDFNPNELKRLNEIPDINLRNAAIRSKANSIAGRTNYLKKTGTLQGITKNNAGSLWKNFYESSKKNNRITLGGTFNGKDLSFRKNWPKRKDGTIDWFIKDKNTGKPAWQMIQFTDSQTPKGNVTFTYDNLQTQVDDAFGKGHFARSTNVYSTQREYFGKNVMFEGKMQPLGRVVAKQRIINDYKKNNFGKVPSEKYINSRLAATTPTQVHHIKGIGNDPYSVQLVSRDANQKLNAAEMTYTSQLKKAKGDPLKVKTVKDNFTKNINQISSEFGGIQYNVDGSVVGKKATVGSAYTSAIKESGMTAAQQEELKTILSKIGCPNKVFKASGGRVGYQDGTDTCPTKGAQIINSGMKNASPAQLKNFAAFANRARALGRGVMKFGIIPEAMYVAADATIRLTMGDKPIEALLRASEYLLPGDQTKLAEMMEATRLMNPETAAIIGRSLDYKNQLAKIQSLEDTRANLENLSGGGEFDYIGNLNQDVRNLDNQIEQATDALNTKFKMTDAEQIYANRMQDEVDDIRKSKSLITKLKSMFRDTGQDASDVETLGAPEVTQEQLNKKLADQLPRDLLLASEAEMLQAAKVAQAQGFKIPDDYYIKQQQDLKNMSLAELAAATSPEQVYGASGTMGEPLFKGVVEKPQNVISDMEREITGQTNVANPFDIDLSMIGSGLRGFSAAGGGIAKQAGVNSGPPPESGPNSQGLSYLMKRGKNI